MRIILNIIISAAAGFFLTLFLISLVIKGVFNIGNVSGIFICVFTLFFSVRPGSFSAFIKSLSENVAGRIFLIFILLFIVTVTVLSVIITVKMVSACSKKPEGEDTVLILLGCGIKEDRPSRMMITRLEAAEEYLNAHKDAVCVLSGGQGRDEEVPECDVMYNRLTKDGIDGSRLIKEDKSASTRQNIEFSLKLLNDEQKKNIAVVTNEFHEYRALKIAEKLGIDAAAVPAKTPWWSLPTFYLRELFGVMYEWVF